MHKLCESTLPAALLVVCVLLHSYEGSQDCLRTQLQNFVVKALLDSRQKLLLTWLMNLDSVSDDEHTPFLFSTLTSSVDPPCPSMTSVNTVCAWGRSIYRQHRNIIESVDHEKKFCLGSES